MAELSVIVPVHNSAQYLSRCLDSIMAQTYKDFELILVDDGSSDKSPALCDQYAEQDDRIRVIHEEARGAAFARETGLRTASGEYVTFPDSDDWLDQEMFASLLSILKENRADGIAAGYTYEDRGSFPRGNAFPSGVYDLTAPQTEEARTFLSRTLYSGSFYTPGIIPSLWSKILRRSLLDPDAAPNPLIRMGDDAARFYPALAKAKKFVVLNESRAYHYRFRSSSQANAFDFRYFDRADLLLRGLDRNLADAPEIHSGLPYYALFILELGIDQYLFHCRNESRTEKQNTLDQAYTTWKAIRPAKDGIRWEEFPGDKARKLQLFTEGKTGKLISLYAKDHFSATIKAVLHRGGAE